MMELNQMNNMNWFNCNNGNINPMQAQMQAQIQQAQIQHMQALMKGQIPNIPYNQIENNFGQMNTINPFNIEQTPGTHLIRYYPTQIKQIKEIQAGSVEDCLLCFFKLILIDQGKTRKLNYPEKDVINIDRSETKLYVNYYNIIEAEVYVNLNRPISEIIRNIFGQIFYPFLVKKVYKRTHSNQTTEFIILNPIIDFDEEENLFMYLNFLCLEFKGKNLSKLSNQSGNYLGLKEGDKLSLKIDQDLFEDFNTFPKANCLLYHYGYTLGSCLTSTKMTYGKLKKIFNTLKYRGANCSDRDSVLLLKFVSKNKVIGGGIYDGLKFVDPSNASVKQIGLSKKAPKWRIISKGLNLFGICKNKKCDAFKNEVVFKTLDGEIQQEGYIFDMIESRSKIRCPICNKIFDPTTCGFYKCEYQFIGEKLEDGENASYDSKTRETKGNTVEYYDPKKGDEARWFKLKIYVLPIQEIKYKPLLGK